MKRISTIIKRTLIAIVVLIIGIEICLRLCVSEKLRERRWPEFVADSTIGFKYKAFDKGERINVAFRNKYRINSLGFNWDEFPKEKQDSIFRIIIIGASDDTGIETDGPNNYIRLLKEYFQGDNVEIINFSIEGDARSLRNTVIINKMCPEYNPDLILMRKDLPLSFEKSFRTSYKGYTIDYTDFDQSLDSVKKFIDLELLSPSFKKILYDISYMYRYLCKYCTERNDALAIFFTQRNIVNLEFMHPYVKKTMFRSNSDIPPITYKSIKESIAIYQETKEFLKTKGCQFILFSTYEMSDQDQLGDILLEKKGVECMPLNIKRLPSYSFGIKDGHSSQEGHKVIADRLFKSLLLEGYISTKFLSKETLNLVSELKKPTNDKSEESLNLTSLDDLFAQSLSSIKEGNYKKILLIVDMNTDIGYSDYLMGLFEEYENKVEVLVKKVRFPNNCKDFLKMINDKFMEYKPNLIITDEPTSIIVESTQHSISMIGRYNESLSKANCRIVFINPSQRTENSVVQYLLQTENVTTAGVNVIFPLTERLSVGAEYLTKLRPRIVADKLFDILRSKYIETQYLNPAKNVAFNKKVHVSSGYNEWGWSNQSVVDGERFHSALSRGWTSWELKKNQNHTEWLLLDLDSIYKVQKLKVYPRNDVGFEGMGFPIDFSIQVSRDSIHWEEVITKKGYSKPKDWKPREFLFEKTNARYILINGTNLPKDTDPRGATYLMCFTEIEVY